MYVFVCVYIADLTVTCLQISNGSSDGGGLRQGSWDSLASDGPTGRPAPIAAGEGGGA